MATQQKTALLIIDIQNDGFQGGRLEVKNAIDIIPHINNLRKNGKFDLIVLTKDWHPKTHVSFQSNHPDSKLFEEIYIEETGVTQKLWPDHCVQGTPGAEFHKDLIVDEKDIIIHKGTHVEVDSYSGFGTGPENTGLDDILKKNGINRVFIVGVCYDYCVGSTATDAAKLGYETYVITDYTRSASPVSEKEMEKRMLEANCKLITSAELVGLQVLSA